MSSAVFLQVKILQSVPQASARPAAHLSDITVTSHWPAGEDTTRVYHVDGDLLPSNSTQRIKYLHCVVLCAVLKYCTVLYWVLTRQTRVSADQSCIKQPAAKQVKEGVHVTPERGGRGPGGRAQKWRGGGRPGGRLPVVGGGRCLRGERSP